MVGEASPQSMCLLTSDDIGLIRTLTEAVWRIE